MMYDDEQTTMSIEDYEELGNATCEYLGTDDIDVKIWLIGVFAVGVCLLSILFNGFFTLVWAQHEFVRKTPVFYFGYLAIFDTIMAINYILVIAVPVYFDYFENTLPIYHMYLMYFRVVFTESYVAMFCSMLLIVLATTERFIKTFRSPDIVAIRRYMEKNRNWLCVACIFIAIAYKSTVFFEIHVDSKNCTGFAQYEIAPTELAMNYWYRTAFMFLFRNIAERILPFCLLIGMNAVIIKALKKEYKRQSISLHSQEEINAKQQRGNLRDATRVLIAIITMYLMSQSLQVIITVWEFFDRATLEEEFTVFYAYANDVVSILTLLSSCFRYPVYCKANRLIYVASVATIKDLRARLCSKRKPLDYEPVPKVALPPINIHENVGAIGNGETACLLIPEAALISIDKPASNEKIIEVQAIELPPDVLRGEQWRL